MVHVIDSGQSNVAAATIVMTDADGQIVATQETDSFGLSTFPVELGRYEVRITGSGFRNEVRQVAVTELRRYDIPVTLKDAGVAETMTVVGDLDQPVNEFNGRAQLPDIQGTAIYHGKRTDSIILDELDAGLAISNQREVFAKVPGMSIWENTSSGFQIGIEEPGGQQRDAEAAARRAAQHLAAV